MSDYYVITCATLIDEMQPFLPPDTPTRVMEFGLHKHPEQMVVALQGEIDRVPPGPTIILGYGLCGRGIHSLCAPHNRLVIPRVHDCIALFLGSREAHQAQFSQEPGTYYLTKGWIESADSPYTTYQLMIEKYGQEKALRLTKLAIASYTRLALITTTNWDANHYRGYAKMVADMFDLRYEEIPGSPELVRQLVQGPWDERFVVLEPGESVDEMVFY